MNNYKEVFQLAQDKGCKLFFLWENPFEHKEDLHSIDQSIIDANKEHSLCELTLIQKWLRDEHKIFVFVLPEEYNAKLWVKINYNDNQKVIVDTCYVYEDALLNGINEALKLI